jgi:hypothetical protein
MKDSMELRNKLGGYRQRTIPNVGTIWIRNPTLTRLRRCLHDSAFSKEEHQQIYAWVLYRRYRGWAQ